MSTAELKEELLELIDKSDSKLLSMMHAMAKVYMDKGQIVGYTVAGDPLTKE